MYRTYKNRQGFTLIELLVVIAIIGLLSSVVMVSLNNARDKAVNASIKQDLAQFRNVATLYQNENQNKYYVSNTNNVCTNQSSGSNPYSVFNSAAKKLVGGTTILTPEDWNDYGVLLYDGSTGLAQCQVNSLQKWIVVTSLKTPENSKGFWCIDSNGNSMAVSASQYADGLNDVLGDSTTLCRDTSYFP